MICGAVKVSDYGSLTLTCNLDADHDPIVHGVRGDPGLPPFLRWGPGVQWTADDEAKLRERQSWRKGHVRREYETLKTWKAKKGL